MDKSAEATGNKIFVYGTLLANQTNCHVWPHASKEIQPACIEAMMFDLGPYPAIVEGDGWVLGELHEVEPDKLAATLEALDALEEYDAANPKLGLYIRKSVPVWTINAMTSAEVYFIQDAAILAEFGKRYQQIPKNVRFLDRHVASWVDWLSSLK
jgi:gamma-glutamylcyclotransferase (GGCT)/AIG2-like uncharacterized protein YtfP